MYLQTSRESNSKFCYQENVFVINQIPIKCNNGLGNTCTVNYTVRTKLKIYIITSVQIEKAPLSLS